MKTSRTAAAALLLTAWTQTASAQTLVPAGERTPVAAMCPKDVPGTAKCYSGQDAAGAYYMIAVPAQWNRVLVMHAHGGPELGAPMLRRSEEDLARWSIMVRAGYAWAGSSFRQGGVAVRAAAEDTERLRQIFIAHVARPDLTVLHGQSWGAGVAAKGAEMYATAAKGTPYDAVLLTSGVIAGGTRSYDFRLDLRVVYQYLCGNHPLPGEPAYALSIGLPPDSKLTRAQLAARADDCLGIRKPPGERTAQQREKLKTIVDVIRIPESSVLGHLNWGTWHFQDVVQKRTGGASPFGNEGVQYKGSADDAALNSGVLRYRADPKALATFAHDTDPTGNIAVPVLTVHATNDAIAFVELESAFRAAMERAGTAGHLVQVYTSHAEHSYLADPVYVAAMAALLEWTRKGQKPTPVSLAERCKALEAQYGADCRLLPDYRPAPLEARVPPRVR